MLSAFASYWEPLRYPEFGSLRVINEDEVVPGSGFGMHAHREQEIFSYIVSGTLERRYHQICQITFYSAEHVLLSAFCDLPLAFLCHLVFSNLSLRSDKDSTGNLEMMKRGDIQVGRLETHCPLHLGVWLKHALSLDDLLWYWPDAQRV